MALRSIHIHGSLPHEDSLLVIQRKYFAWHIKNIKDYVQEQSSNYVFNSDEIGSSCSESWKLEQVVVPVSVTKEDMDHTIS
jgi:hypothetical protein